MYVHRLFNFSCNCHPSGAPPAALVSSLPASIQPSTFKYQERRPWNLYCTVILLQISRGIQSTCEFLNTDLEPSSIWVTNDKEWQTLVHFLTFFPGPHQACPDCHPASSLRSVTSASPLSLRSANTIQPCSWLVQFLFLSSLEQGLTVTRESQEEAKKERKSDLEKYLLYVHICCMAFQPSVGCGCII